MKFEPTALGEKIGLRVTMAISIFFILLKGECRDHVTHNKYVRSHRTKCQFYDR